MDNSEETNILITTNNVSEPFNLLEYPKADTELVKYHRDKMFREMEIQNLVTKFNLLGDLIRMAENASINQTEIHLKVREVGHKVLRLCGDTCVAIQAFETASDQVLESLQTAYDYLLNACEDEAIINIQSIDKTAEAMQNIAEDLKKSAEEAGKDARLAAGDTLKAEENQKIHRIRTETEQKIEVLKDLRRDKELAHEEKMKHLKEREKNIARQMETMENIKKLAEEAQIFKDDISNQITKA
ncbi:6459_t:CDS:2, partial [Racocetra fulgida]